MSSLTRYVREHFLLVTAALAILLVLGWYGMGLGIAMHVIHETFDVNLARDAKTDEYLGEVVSELKDPETRRVTGYRIRLNSGDVIERPATSVIVFNP